MEVRSSRFSMNRRQKRSNPWRVITLLLLVGAAAYVNFVIVPVTPPLGVPTSTPTRAPESYTSDAQALEAAGKYNQAIGAYQQAIKIDPKNVTNYVSLARLQIYAGMYQEAVTSAENALILNPNSSISHALRCWALGFLEDYLDAQTSCQKAISLDPNSAPAYAYLAEVLTAMSQTDAAQLSTMDQAIEASRTAERLSPNSLEAHRARGMVLEATQNNAEAVTEFEAAIAINKYIPDLYLALGRNYRILEEYDKAINAFNQAIPLAPTDPLPKTYLSRTYAAAGQFSKAIQYAQQALKDDPLDPNLYGNLGSMYYRNRDLEKAVDYLRIAIRGGVTEDGQEVKGLPLDYGRVAEYYYTYGLSLARLGQCGEALQISQMLQQAVKDDDTAVYNAKAMIDICQQQAAGGLATPTPTVTPTLLPGQKDITPTP